jgi:hypothetical protein
MMLWQHLTMADSTGLSRPVHTTEGIFPSYTFVSFVYYAFSDGYVWTLWITDYSKAPEKHEWARQGTAASSLEHLVGVSSSSKSKGVVISF